MYIYNNKIKLEIIVKVIILSLTVIEVDTVFLNVVADKIWMGASTQDHSRRHWLCQ